MDTSTGPFGSVAKPVQAAPGDRRFRQRPGPFKRDSTSAEHGQVRIVHKSPRPCGNVISGAVVSDGGSVASCEGRPSFPVLRSKYCGGPVTLWATVYQAALQPDPLDLLAGKPFLAERHPDAAVIVSPRSGAVPSETAVTAPTQRDLHLQLIAERGRMGWQKAPGYNWRHPKTGSMSSEGRVLLRHCGDGSGPIPLRNLHRRPPPDGTALHFSRFGRGAEQGHSRLILHILRFRLRVRRRSRRLRAHRGRRAVLDLRRGAGARWGARFRCAGIRLAWTDHRRFGGAGPGRARFRSSRRTTRPGGRRLRVWHQRGPVLDLRGGCPQRRRGGPCRSRRGRCAGSRRGRTRPGTRRLAGPGRSGGPGTGEGCRGGSRPQRRPRATQRLCRRLRARGDRARRSALRCLRQP